MQRLLINCIILSSKDADIIDGSLEQFEFGSEVELALLRFLKLYNINLSEIRTSVKVIQHFKYSKDRKRSSVIVEKINS